MRVRGIQALALAIIIGGIVNLLDAKKLSAADEPLRIDSGLISGTRVGADMKVPHLQRHSLRGATGGQAALAAAAAGRQLAGRPRL